jgi:hypothetical protein
MGVEGAENVPDGFFLSCLLYAIGDGEYIPGRAAGLPPDKTEKVRGILQTALSFQIMSPAHAFRDNPAKAERSREIAARRRTFFFETFQSDETRGTGREIAAAYARFRTGWLGREAAAVLYPDMVLEAIPQSIAESGDAALIMDARGELLVPAEWSAFLEACRTGAEEESQSKLVARYLVSTSGLLPLWDRALHLHPETARKALSRLVDPAKAEGFAAAVAQAVEQRASVPPCVAVLDPQLAGAIPAFVEEMNRKEKEAVEEEKKAEAPKLWVPGTP